MVGGEWAACTDVWLSSFRCASLGISNGVLPAPPGRALPAVVALKPGRSVTAEELLQVCRASRPPRVIGTTCKLFCRWYPERQA